MLMITSLMMLMTFLFMFMNHPLSFGLILLIQTVSISLMTGIMNYNFWFSYILFLIMIGGMLILFIYMTSIASNEKFKFSNKILTWILLFIILNFLLIFMDSFMTYKNLNSEDLIMQNWSLNMNYNNYSMSKFFNFPNNMIIFILITYLLITLIVTVKITKIKYGPIRQKN